MNFSKYFQQTLLDSVRHLNTYPAESNTMHIPDCKSRIYE